ncbi:MAG: TonB-dependent receptor [Dysgonamonadaceae bacterium]|jgi:TonB-linked SusC/RagA family outer membrane protein|nr:TonB-dependent receptor [Dysgonamonadaceae bacterium]
MAYGQSIPVSGAVTDVRGEVIIGASVVEKGATSNGTITDKDGKFNLRTQTNAVLVISYVGYVQQELKIGNGKDLVVVLPEDVGQLDEVVVVGYGTQKKANLTGAVASVKGETLAKSPVASTVNTLAGRLPGLVVKQTSGAPGMDQSGFNIRNFGSALVIVDGVEQSFNQIDPNEIESISILKDASAAIYGARAGNGVVLVKTKRGNTSAKPLITINTSFTGQAYTNFVGMPDAGQYAELYREAQVNAGVAEQNMRFSEEDVAKYKAGNDPRYPNTDWEELIMRKWSPQHQHNVAIEGGNETARYYVFLGYLNQDGMFKGGISYYNRYNVRSNLDLTIAPRLTLSLDLAAIKEKVNQSARPPGDDNEWFWMDFLNANPTSFAAYPDKTKVPRTGGGDYNPILNTNEDLIGYNRDFKTRLNGSVTLDYKMKFIEGMGAKFRMNYYQYIGEKKIWTKQVETWNYDWDSDIYTLAWRSIPSELTQSYNTNQTITGQFSLYYDRLFNQAHSVNALLLLEAIDYNSKNLSGYRNKYLSSAIDQLYVGNSDGQIANGSESESARESLVGRINYGYLGKYLAEATLRYDGSPNFPKNKRWGLFPSLSVGWRLSEEPFFKNKLTGIQNLKLRGGMSRMGFDDVAAYQYLAGFQFSGYYVVDGKEVNVLSSTGLPNPNITWESMTLSNIGFDLSVLKDRLYIEADVFQRLRENILATRTAALPNTFGASLPSENINSQIAKGFELLIGHRNKIGDFQYDINGNISYSRAKWKHYEEVEYTDPDDIRTKKKTGQWVDAGFGYIHDGLFTSQMEIDLLPYDMDGQGNKTLSPGDVKYLDTNEDGVLNWRDQHKINDGGMPHIMYGFNVGINYKRFDFSMLIQGAADYTVTLQAYNIIVDSERTPPKVVYDRRWTPENNDKYAIIPRPELGQVTNTSSQWGSNYWNRDASYVRLKNINIGYTFDSQLMSKIGVRSLRLYLIGTNLFTVSDVTKYGFDPESPSGTRGWTYPIQKTFTAGLSLKF